MKLKYLICNLKAHKTYNEIIEYKENIEKIDTKNVNLILAPSLIYLSLFKNQKNKNISLATQDISLNNNLHLTGDISLDGLQSLDIKYAIIGHAERRIFYGESDYTILNKIKACLENNIKVIYCIGESLEELNRKVEYQILEKQIARIFNFIPKSEFKNIIIAYEPHYLIGENTPYNIESIEEKTSFIKKIVWDYYESKIEVVFGGNVNLENIESLQNIKNIDGFMLGTSSLNSANITKIIDKITLS